MTLQTMWKLLMWTLQEHPKTTTDANKIITIIIF